MTVLGRLLAGDGSPVLQTCRFEGLGGDLYGREAIDNLIRDLPLKAASLDVETARLGVWMDDDHAVVADLLDGHVQRVWLMAQTVALRANPSVDIPADPDLAQARPALRFDPSDHPELADDDAGTLANVLGHGAAWGIAAPRPLVLRAASFGLRVAALLRLEGEATDDPARPVAFNALMLVGPDGDERRLDLAGRAQALGRAWTPRL